MADYRPDRVLDRDDLPDPDDPLAGPEDALAAWLPADDDPERPLMTLGTVDADGRPDARTVLLSGFDDAGLHFHTDAGSRKAAQLRADPRAVATLVWPEQLRQLVVRGEAVPVAAGVAASAYARRPRYLQLLAWLNTHSYAQLPAAERAARWARFETEHADGSLEPPEHWLGFALRPDRVTFWQGRADRASIRVEYRRAGDSWLSECLPG